MSDEARQISIAVAAFVLACGSGAATKAPTVTKGDAGDAPIAPALAASIFRPTSNVPPMPMPSTPFFGSKIGTVRAKDGFKAPALLNVSGRPGADVGAFARASSAAPAKKVASFVGKVDPSAPPAVHPFSALEGKCYRVYIASKSGAVATVAIVDSAGATAVEGRARGAVPLAAGPEAGAVCFQRADLAQVVVSVGLGDGEYAVELWSD